MLSRIKVGNGTNMYIPEAIQIFTVAWKTLSAAAVVNYIFKDGIVPPGELESEIESESDVHMVQNWQNFYRKLVIVPLLKRL
jgi:hypothetical protein